MANWTKRIPCSRVYRCVAARAEEDPGVPVLDRPAVVGDVRDVGGVRLGVGRLQRRRGGPSSTRWRPPPGRPPRARGDRAHDAATAAQGDGDPAERGEGDEQEPEPGWSHSPWWAGRPGATRSSTPPARLNQLAEPARARRSPRTRRRARAGRDRRRGGRSRTGCRSCGSAGRAACRPARPFGQRDPQVLPASVVAHLAGCRRRERGGSPASRRAGPRRAAARPGCRPPPRSAARPARASASRSVVQLRRCPGSRKPPTAEPTRPLSPRRSGRSRRGSAPCRAPRGARTGGRRGGGRGGGGPAALSSPVPPGTSRRVAEPRRAPPPPRGGERRFAPGPVTGSGAPQSDDGEQEGGRRSAAR